MTDRPKGITAEQWKYYQMGQKAHAEGLPKEAGGCVFEMRHRAWWYAGFHDSDILKAACVSPV